MTPLPDARPHDRDAGDGGSDATAHDPADTPGGSDPKPRLTVLLLEDDLNQAEPLRDMLHYSGYVCVIARNKDLARAELSKPDQLCSIMIADLNLAQSDDDAFVRETRNMPRYTGLPVIITTGHDSPPAREQARLLGRTEYLVKPFPTSTLLQHIARWTSVKP